jgi:hypothetical protein
VVQNGPKAFYLFNHLGYGTKVGIEWLKPIRLRKLFDESADRKAFLQKIEQLTELKIVTDHKVTKYHIFKHKISLRDGLEQASDMEFLCTLAHELDHAKHRWRSLITLGYVLIFGAVSAVIWLRTFAFELLIKSMILAALITFALVIIRTYSLWQLQAEAFGMATIGLEVHKPVRFKKISTWRRLFIQALFPDRLYKNIEKRAKEFLKNDP